MKIIDNINYLGLSVGALVVITFISVPLWYSWVQNIAMDSQYQKEITYKKALLQAAKYDSRIAKYKLEKQKLLLAAVMIDSEIKNTAGPEDQMHKFKNPAAG